MPCYAPIWGRCTADVPRRYRKREGVESLARQAFGTIDKQRSGRWRARFVHPTVPFRSDGTPNRISAPSTFRTKRDAQDWLARVQSEIAADTWRSPAQVEADRVAAEIAARRDALTFGDYADDWLAARNIRPTTRRAYESMLRTHLVPHWGMTPLKAITTTDVRTWLAELAPGAPVMRRRAFELFSTLMATAVDDDLLAVTPVKRNMLASVAPAPAPESAADGRKRPAKRVPRALSPGELTALADAVPDYLRLPVLLAGTVGLRSGELRALTGQSVETLPGGITVLHVTKGVTGHGTNVHVGPPKTKAGVRTVPVPESLRDDLVALADMVGADGLLFHANGDAGRVLPERTLQGHLSAAGERAGLGHVTPHDLRHSAISQAIAAGAAPTEVRDLVGHTKTSMTDHYTHTGRDQLVRIVDSIDRARTEPQADNVVPLVRRRMA